ncbi:exodeoxyribonuclease V subunit beta [Guyparkeria sp.]|uniref:exodeoxyribonuclease V subunit beta n=1 Tax=Guyparkeria sp. TaxID=2035736 RepID=UPI00356B4B90
MSQLDPVTFPLESSRLIEASAGTGKTFTISLLYLRLVLGHRGPDRRDARPLTPPEILVSTFTEAAVAELRDRIRARLQEAAWLFSGSVAPDEVDPPLRSLYEAFDEPERARGAFLLQRAAEWMDEAAIFTIHGFCQRMLREHAFHSRALFEQELVTDLDPVVSEAVRDFWRSHGYPLTRRDDETARQFARMVPPPAKLKEKIKDLLKRDGSPVALGDITAHRADDLPDPADLLERISGEQADVDRAEEAARARWREDPATLHALWLAVRTGLSKSTHPEAKQEDEFTAWLGAIDAWATGEAQLEEKTRRRLAYPNTNKGTEAPSHPALDAIREWQDRAEAMKRKEKDVEPAIQAFAALWIRERIASLLARHRSMGFEDMLIQMQEAVDPAANPNAAGMIQAIRQQYPVALIDEFQDTDPLQYSIFSAIYPLGHDEAGDTAIVLIGDPKQAIYSFRGADIHSYLTARRATEGRHATLPTNFRSTRAMVDAVNHLFERADRHPAGAFRFPRDELSDEPNPLPFHPVEAHGRSSRLIDRNGEELPALTTWTVPAGEEWNAGTFREAMAMRTAGEIAAMLNDGQSGDCRFEGDESRGLQPRDIAVLVRNQEEGKSMRRVLTDFGVPAVFLSERSSVFRSTEAADMLIWLEALAEPERSDRIRQAMSTASLALGLDELSAWLRDEVVFDEICNRFHGWHRVWQNQGVLAALMGLLHHFSVPARLLSPEERTARRGERRLTNILHLAEWLQARDHDVDGDTALIHRLHLAMTEGGNEQEIRLEQDSEMVRIVTVHSSKGLQYPVVFLPFAAVLGSEKNNGNKPTRRHRHDENVWEMEPDEAAAERATREATAEEIRLLYVALTRAEFACILGAGPVKIGKVKRFNPGKTAWGQFLGFESGETCERDDYMARLAEWGENPGIRIDSVPDPRDPARCRFVPPPEPELAEPRVPQFGKFSPWWIASFSSISASASHGPTLPAPEIAREEVRLESDTLEGAGPYEPDQPVTPTGVHALPRGAGIGNLFHDMIEAMFNDGLARYAGHPERVRQRLVNSHHPGLRDLTDEQLEQVADQFDTLVGTSWQLPASASPMALAQLETAQAEMEFWLSLQEADTVDVDRLVRRFVAAGAPRPELEARTLNGMLKGFIDLTIAHDGRYYLLDWKSNWLGPDESAYGSEALERAMLESRYDLQFVLYLVALHRHLADRLPDYDYDRHIGGAAYVFLRGIRPADGTAPDNHGVYTCRPDRELIESLDALFTGQREHAA